ncbi:hypothetical protein V6N13_108298 [Hibiscus sabdariffa]|uniref:RNase H type-1 domain-containing protein n=1 Tax=Hibiscus sabdariffa TaxID=183260 RepID=A0ABR2SSR5_9ROSI
MVIKDVQWFPFDDDTIKVNFDEPFNIASKSFISRIIARDSRGLIMVACTYPHSGVVDTFIEEAIACEKVVTFAINLGFCSMHVEGDSLSVIKKLASATTNKSIISPIISDIQILRDSFEKLHSLLWDAKGMKQHMN